MKPVNRELTDEDRQLVARLGDMLYACEKGSSPRYTAFLDERQCALLSSELKRLGFVNCLFWGGYEGAGRKILCVCNEFDEPLTENFPIRFISIRYRKADKLVHRDFLGAIMSCMVKREAIGDIIISDGHAQVPVLASVCDMLLNELDKIGSVGVKLDVSDGITVCPVQEFENISGTVASMRLDAVVSLAIGKSREKTAALIKAQGVDVNFFKSFSPSDTIAEGDIFSVRGCGKYIVDKNSGISKKGRFRITVKKYI